MMAAKRPLGRVQRGTASLSAILLACLPLAGQAWAQQQSAPMTAMPAPLPMPVAPHPTFGTVPALAPILSEGNRDHVSDGTSLLSLPQPVPAPQIRISADQTPARDGPPATVLANHLGLSGDNNMSATGGVVIWYQGNRLIADEVSYDGTTGDVTIKGPIHLTQPSKGGSPAETTIIADSAQLDGNMQDGILRGARLVLAQELQMAASEVTRKDSGRFTVLDRVVASSCNICSTNPTPLWEIRARRITHDAQTRQLYFENPQFRAFGIPIGALPALSAPDPTVERMTGMLRPQFRTTSRLGFGIKIPYFITLGDHADLLATPYVSASRTRTLDLRYRQAFTNGMIELQGALSRDDIASDKTRGYLFGAARFDLPRNYRLFLQLQSATDRAYLLDYDITDADRLWSGLMIDRIRRDRFFYARIGRYETLRPDEPKAFTPNNVADVIWHRRWKPSAIGGEAGLEWSVHAHQRPSSQNWMDSNDNIGRDAVRGSLSLDWRRSHILPYGVVGAVAARLDADIYHVRQDTDYEGWFARADPVIATELRWPLIRAGNGVTHIIEPVAQLVWSPKRNWDDDIRNEDSRLIEFDEGNLFSLGRFPGHDARESGLRANLGVSWTRLDPTGWSLSLTGGRVMRGSTDTAYGPESPLWGKSSDWLVAAQYSHPDGLAIANRTLFNDSLSVSRNDLRLGWLRPDLQVSLGYLWMDRDNFESRDQEVSELTAIGGWQIKDGWWATTETRYDFTADRAQKAQLGLEYRNECVTMEMAVERRFTSSQNLRPETSFEFGVRLNGFGSQKDVRGTVARRSCLR